MAGGGGKQLAVNGDRNLIMNETIKNLPIANICTKIKTKYMASHKPPVCGEVS